MQNFSTDSILTPVGKHPSSRSGLPTTGVKNAPVPRPARTPLLDLFSTSENTLSEPTRCHKNAPFICIPGEGSEAILYQGCCNDWNCPRCGQLRAKHEYGRIIEGARELAKTHALYMMSVTCRGDVSLNEAEENYLLWTHRLNAKIYAYEKHFSGEKPEYVAITERQIRQHPHSHMITTFHPRDAYFIVDEYERYCADVARLNRCIPKNMRFSPDELKDIDHRQMFSMWLALACVECGLGVQVRIAICDVVEGASRYIAKYLFKTLTAEKWPEGWRRVRYSQGWPKLPEMKAKTAFAVMTQSDWFRVYLLRKQVNCLSKRVCQIAINHLVFTAYYVDWQGVKRDRKNIDTIEPPS